VLFSATLPPRINAIAKRHLTDPVKIQIGLGDTKPGKALVRQSVYIVQRNHKSAALGRILDVEAPTAAIVFCRTRTEVDQLTETLNGRGYRAEALHGGLSQESRDRVMNRLRSGTTELLVATDVAARGLDIDQLTHVVNYDVPSAPESYVHRIGRVGRAGRQGVAITLAEPREQRLLSNIERLTKQKIGVEKVPSVADLRARQIELTLGTLREALEADDLDRYDDVVDTLVQQFDIRQVALAAIKLAHEAGGAVVDEKEIPDASVRAERKPDRSPDRKVDRGGDRTHPEKGRSQGNGETARVYVGVGRKDGIRPGDLVGAIANETSLSGREIGPIKLAEHFAIVGIPEWSTDEVIAALKGTTLKGKKATIRRYTD
jgi:ATP-dependent RNA helicase DeaD